MVPPTQRSGTTGLMSPERSKANPTALEQFADTTLQALATLRTKSDDVTGTLGTLADGGGADYLPQMGTVATDLSDLVGDWEHLAGFAGQVADGFFRVLGDELGVTNHVVSVWDHDVVQQAQVGYADRDEAIAAAEAMAERLQELRDEGYAGLSPEAVWELLAMAERGQHDPAFAVAFSEAVGVEGYVDLTAMIRGSYQRGGIYEPVPAEGIAGVQILGTMLTTALGTQTDSSIPSEERLSDEFVNQLARDFDPEEGRSNTDFPPRTDTDLSVLVSFVDPPTQIAVAIAAGRLTPLLGDPDRLDVRPGDEGADWGGFGGEITNYASMLERNPDASALWLDRSNGDGTRNIDLVLQRNPDFGDHRDMDPDVTDVDIDGGQTLAAVVENGLTNQNPAYDSRGPDGEMRPISERIMDRAIDVIGGEQDQIRNPHLYGVLAEGVANHLDLIHDRTNGDAATSSLLTTHDFLRELVYDDDAARQVTQAITGYVGDNMLELPTDSAHRGPALEDNGRLLALLTNANANADIGAIEDRLERQRLDASGVDYALSWVPGVDELNDVVAVLSGQGAGGHAMGEEPLRPEDLADILRPHADALTLDAAGFTAVAHYESGTWTTEQVIQDAGGVDFFDSQPGDPDRAIKPVNQMSENEQQAFLDWAISPEVTGRQDGVAGPARNDHNDILRGAWGAWIDLQMRT